MSLSAIRSSRRSIGLCAPPTRASHRGARETTSPRRDEERASWGWCDHPAPTRDAERPSTWGTRGAGFGLGSELSATQTLPRGRSQVTSGGLPVHRRCSDENDKTPSSGLVGRRGGPTATIPSGPAVRRHGPGRPDRRRQQHGRAYSSRNVSHICPLSAPDGEKQCGMHRDEPGLPV